MSVGSKWNEYGTAGKGLTDEQCAKAYEEFYDRVKDLFPLEAHDPQSLNEEDTLIKFLTARKYNVDLAEKMLRNYFDWRKAFDAGSLFLSPFPDIYATNYEAGFCGHDREGHPLYIEYQNGKRLSELLKAQPTDMVFRWHTYLVERQREVMKHWNNGQISLVIDAKNLGMGIATNMSALSMLKRFAQHDQAMYPEGMRFMFVVNAPAAASGLWKVVSPLLDPVVREKIHIWGPKEWPGKIAKYVDIDILPERLGGKASIWYPITADPKDYKVPPPPADLKKVTVEHEADDHEQNMRDLPEVEDSEDAEDAADS